MASFPRTSVSGHEGRLGASLLGLTFGILPLTRCVDTMVDYFLTGYLLSMGDYFPTG